MNTDHEKNFGPHYPKTGPKGGRTNDNKLIQSYVRNRYFVSTAHRRASTAEPLYFYEHFAWEWDSETKKRGNLIFEDMSNSFHCAFNQHLQICVDLAERHHSPNT